MRIARATLRAVLVAVVLALPARALADEPKKKKPQPEEHNFFFGSVLALGMDRLSFGGEHLPTNHHAVSVSLFGMAFGITHGGPNVAKGTVIGGGGEVGYRYYVGENGPTGPFFGVSWIGGYYHSRADLYEPDPNAKFYAQWGGAIDMGYAAHVDREIVVAFAIGAQRTWIDARGPISDLAGLLVGEGVRPRFQFLIGKAW